MQRADLASMTLEQLTAWFAGQGEKPFRGQQVFRALHQRRVASFDEMTDLTRDLRTRLAEVTRLPAVEILEERAATDGTRKFRFGLLDGKQVEGVWMPDQRRRTLCVSTQVGCAMGCQFCATGTMGLARNLSAGEIIGQLEAVHRHLVSPELKRPVSNVVFMGMGEPLANLDAVIDAAGMMLHDLGANLSRRHVTVSTIGLVPAMETFVRRCSAKLAVSLNATTDEVRSRLMPVNRRYPIPALLHACRNLPFQGADRVTFEYVLLGGINDSLDDARRLVKLVSSLRCKVNLIPYNPFEGLPFEKPPEDRVEQFLEFLAAKQISAFVRRSRGESLRAACGQLVAAGARVPG